VETGGGRVTVSGIAKGAGMIRPDMATLLTYVATDARVAPAALRAMLDEALPRSFNAITIDGDTSTNDSIVLIASQQSGALIDSPQHPEYRVVADAVIGVCELLAQAIVRDGEGATRFVTLEVSGARDVAEAREVADAVAHSPLVKTALFAGDANWGRILAAVGRARIDHLDVRGVSIQLDDVPLIRGSEPDPGYRDALGTAVLKRPEYTIAIDLGRGTARTRVWTCDLSFDYVRINAEYRS
jgi:glutamate N-acetyltransferase/amino-acid N-acetyltransferase